MPPPEVVDVLSSPDPAAAFAAAHRANARIALATSGTTGRSRTVVRTTRSWLDSFAHVTALLGIGKQSRVWVPGPLTATMNLFATVHADWAGAARVDEPRRATHAQLTPSALHRELATRPDDLAGLHILTAGDRLSRSCHDLARAAGARVSHYYGASELSFVAWGDHAEALRPFPGVELAERDGFLWVRSPYVCDGYLEGDRQLRRDDEGWVTVGDLGRLVDGTVRVLGRDGGITTGGTTVLAAEVEHVLRSHAAGEVLVLGVPHAELGEVVVAVVTHRDDVPRLRAVSRRELAPAERPRRWLHCDPVPVTDNGKIDRAAVSLLSTGVVRER